MTDLTTRLRGENLTLGYGKKIIARDLSVAIPDGHFTAIIGPNGCGKSTLLRTLSRLMSPVEGSVFLDGEQIQRFASKEVARRIGLLAQNATTPGDITVQELVSRGRYPHQPLFTRWRKEDDEAVKRAMQATGITELAQQSVDTLSGGQRQALTLLMATLQKPKLLLLDEHTAALDPKTARKVLDLTEKIVDEQNLTALMVTHNMKDAIQIGNRLIMMHEGRIIYDVAGEEKKNLQVEDLLERFEKVSGEEFANDRMMLAK